MPAKVPPHSPPSTNQEPLPALVNQLRGLIESARQQALRAVDTVQVRTCWEIGRHIVEFEQQGAERASYGSSLITKLATMLTTEFGRGFDASNLRYMRLFYQAFQNCDALRHELSWTHYRTLLRVENEQARLIGESSGKGKMFAHKQALNHAVIARNRERSVAGRGNPECSSTKQFRITLP